MSIACPACRAPGPHKTRRGYTLDEVVARYAAAIRCATTAETAERVARLREIIRERWQQDHVEIQHCQQCHFGFVVPYVDAGAEFFALLLAVPFYPRERWEFGVARQLIRQQAAPSPGQMMQVLDVGGGDGKFVQSLLADPSLAGRIKTVVCDYSVAAVERLQNSGIQAGAWTPAQMLADPSLARKCDFVCSFQCIDEIADLEGLFAGFYGCLRPGGQLLVSVKNGLCEEYDDAVLGMSRMPPVFVTHWYQSSIPPLAQRHGFEVVELRLSQAKSWAEIWGASKQRALGERSVTSSLAKLANRLPIRTIRGGLKICLISAMVPLVALGPNGPPPSVLFMHLRRPG